MSIRPVAFVLVAACAHHVQSEPGGGDPGVDATSPASPTVTIERITDEHRAVPGAMFGGWGPHLGHLIHGATSLWIDDLCSPAVPGDCDVNIDRRVGVFELVDGGWRQRTTIPLTGVQENTGALVDGGAVYVYGVAGRNVLECTEAGCATIPLDIGDAANYVGAAVMPGGGRVVWWTNVVDGGGGSFAYLVNYGGGWNGPRRAAIGGYNACAYAHVTFDGDRARWFCQVVAGLAPNWSFSTLTGTSDAALAEPVAWVVGLAPPAGDTIMSTNDLLGAHLLARSTNGAAVYYHDDAGAYTQQLVVPNTYRARWIDAADTFALALDVDAHTGLAIRTTPRATLPAGALDPSTWAETRVPLPADFGSMYAIYPVSPAYQDATIPDVELVVVGSGDEHAAYHVTWRP
jgi:hypothetical protein